MSTKPVFKVNYPNPTADKPQSKLWERTFNGWFEDKIINELLSGIPGKVDVYAQDSSITTVGVGNLIYSIPAGKM